MCPGSCKLRVTPTDAALVSRERSDHPQRELRKMLNQSCGFNRLLQARAPLSPLTRHHPLRHLLATSLQLVVSQKHVRDPVGYRVPPLTVGAHELAGDKVDLHDDEGGDMR